MSTTSIFQRLRDDHARVLAAIDALEQGASEPGAVARPGADLGGLVSLLQRQFAIHMCAEDDVLFPALIDTLPEARDTLAPLRAEHDELRSMLTGLAQALARPAAPIRDEQISVQVRDLVDLLRIHVRKEEALVFGIAERVLPERTLHRIAERLEQPLTPNPGGLTPGSTREESDS
jgi:hemerythrin-like domain-containing protein